MKELYHFFEVMSYYKSDADYIVGSYVQGGQSTKLI